jgi:transposase
MLASSRSNGLFTWDWLAARCAQEGMPCVLGHALSLKAIPGGKAKNDTIDAPKIAVLLRGGMRPQAYVDPAARRATRALLRRRMHFMRKRAALRTHVQNTTRQDNLPEMGRKIADKTTRAGVAERFAEPAVQQSIAVALALMGHDDALRRAVERSLLKAAKPRHSNPLYRLRTVPGIGEILRLVLLYELHAIQRCPRVPEFVSSCRLGTCATESAGQRDGTSGTKIGHAYLQGAFSEAAVLVLRANPAGQKDRGRREKQPGQGQAWTVLAHQRARAVSDMLQRDTAFEMHKFLTG